MAPPHQPTDLPARAGARQPRDTRDDVLERLARIEERLDAGARELDRLRKVDRATSDAVAAASPPSSPRATVPAWIAVLIAVVSAAIAFGKHQQSVDEFGTRARLADSAIERLRERAETLEREAALHRAQLESAAAAHARALDDLDRRLDALGKRRR